MNQILIVTKEAPMHPHRIDDGKTSFIRMSIGQWHADPSKFDGLGQLDAVILLDKPPKEMYDILTYRLTVKKGGVLHQYKLNDEK